MINNSYINSQQTLVKIYKKAWDGRIKRDFIAPPLRMTLDYFLWSLVACSSEKQRAALGSARGEDWEKGEEALSLSLSLSLSPEEK